MEREQIISEIDTKIKYAKFTNTDAVFLSSKAALFCLEHAQFYEQKIKELTEDNERLSKEVTEYKDKLCECNAEIYRLQRETEKK